MSKNDKYIWGINKELPIIDDHSLVKLEIIEKYLETYIKHLAIFPFTDKLKFAIIDGFSGGGLYKTTNNQVISGSPLRILQTIERLQKEINIERESKKFKIIDFHIPIYLIEKDKDTFKFLQKTLSERNLSSMYKAINGEFEKIYLQIIQKLKIQKYQRAIFILDQYGYADATIKTIKNILTNFKNAEVILTFACDSLIDYLSGKKKTALINLGLENHDIEHLLDTKTDNDDNRKILQFNLLDSIIKKINPHFYTPFFVKGERTHRAYWLLHFSNHPTARNEMVKLHYENHNAFIHYGGNGLDMFGYSSKDKKTLNPFLFAEADRQKSLKSITKQIQGKITQYDNKTFGDFIKNEINDTPATIEVIQDSLREVLYNKEIEVIDTKKNKKIRNCKDIKLENLIRIPKIRQGRFNF